MSTYKDAYDLARKGGCSVDESWQFAAFVAGYRAGTGTFWRRNKPVADLFTLWRTS